VSGGAQAPVRAWVGIGANLEDPRRQVETALGELAALPSTRLVTASSRYRTPPMGPPDQPDYVNAVAELETALAPLALLDELQRIESAHLRQRGAERWGPRTLDLDLLLYGDARLDLPRLTVPHPGIADRAFVLVPLAEIAPDLSIPGLGPLRRLVEKVSAAGMEKL
jgi:2-amino-4-hydroxy-6-hydroxymethyldihydropteridine diphosphokinase